MNELEKIDKHIAEGRDEKFIINCLQCCEVKFIIAARNGYTNIVSFMIDHGADVNAQNDLALRWASEKGRMEVVKVLLAGGADVHAENDWALRGASNNGQVEVVKLLLEDGADVHAKDDEALRWATASDKVMMKVLQEWIEAHEI